eukprot:SM000001S04490  [mRNA]  locus=s1:494535:499176:+ [translate_table: standard]
MAAPVTEASNELAQELDAAGAQGIVRVLRACDGQAFAGYRSFPGLQDAEVRREEAQQLKMMAVVSAAELVTQKKERASSVIQEAVDALTAIAVDILASPQLIPMSARRTCSMPAELLNDSGVIISGAGTSGRLAYCAARSYNKLLSRRGLPRSFHHLIAGGDDALLEVQEGAEDDAAKAVERLQELERRGTPFGKQYNRLIFVGISCGLSATSVAAQVQLTATYHSMLLGLQYAMSKSHYAVALIGFNPATAARRVKVQGFGHNVLDVVTQLKRSADMQVMDDRRHFLINPVVGPVASSMINGSLQTSTPTVSHTALSGRFRSPVCAPASYYHTLLAYEGVYRAAYTCLASTAALVEEASDSLQAGGSIYYIGGTSGGLVGLIDAVEQVPTFGALPEHVQGFIAGGWPALSSAIAPAAHDSRRNASSLACTSPAGLTGTDKAAAVTRADGNVDAKLDEENPSMSACDVIVASSSRAGDAKEGSHVGAPSDMTRVQATADRQEEHVPENGLQSGLPDESEGPGAPLSAARVSTKHFVSVVLPRARHYDTIIVLHASEDDDLPPSLVSAILQKKQGKGIQLALVTVGTVEHDRLLCIDFEVPKGTRGWGFQDEKPLPAASPPLGLESVADIIVRVELPAACAAPLLPRLHSLAELAIKYVTNAISTGAHVLIGKVYRSLMVDLRITNSKLLHRAAHIVAELISLSEAGAMEYVVRAIYTDDILGLGLTYEDVRLLPASEHILRASRSRRIVPLALLLATGLYSVRQAADMVGKPVSVRTLIEADLAARKSKLGGKTISGSLAI